MGVLFDIVTSPVTVPAKGFLFICQKIQEEADKEVNDPTKVRAQLMNAQQRLDAGDIDEDTYDVVETKLLARLDAIGQRQQAAQEAAATAHGARPGTRKRRRNRPRRRATAAFDPSREARQ